MGAPTTWSTPAGGSTSTNNEWTYQPISYCGGYWFCLSQQGANVVLRYATNPAGTWSTATLPAAPATYTVRDINRDNGVVFGNGTFAFLQRYINGGAVKVRVVHATDPAGTWSAHEYDATDTYLGVGFTYADGNFIVVGSYTTPTPDEGFIAYCSTADGTYYTSGSGNTATGYDPATGAATIRAIAFDGTTWVTTASFGAGYAARYSTSLTSGWAAPSSITFTGIPDRVVHHGNGWWTIHSGQLEFLHTDTPSGTWAQISTAEHGFDTYAGDIAWGGGYWVAVGSDDPLYQVPLISYLESSGTPDGTYTDAPTDWSTPARNAYGENVAFADGYFVAVQSSDGELRWVYTRTPRPFPRPSGLPGNARLRQRQTHIITK